MTSAASFMNLFSLIGSFSSSSLLTFLITKAFHGYMLHFETVFRTTTFRLSSRTGTLFDFIHYGQLLMKKVCWGTSRMKIYSCSMSHQNQEEDLTLLFAKVLHLKPKKPLGGIYIEYKKFWFFKTKKRVLNMRKFTASVVSHHSHWSIFKHYAWALERIVTNRAKCVTIV